MVLQKKKAKKNRTEKKGDDDEEEEKYLYHGCGRKKMFSLETYLVCSFFYQLPVMLY